MPNKPVIRLSFPEADIALLTFDDTSKGANVLSSHILGELSAHLDTLDKRTNLADLVISGETVDAKAAYKMGLASDVVPPQRIQEAAIRLIRAEQSTQQYLEDRRRWNGPVNIGEVELGFLGATASAVIQQQTKGHY